MESFFGLFFTPGNEQMDCTVLVKSDTVTIGYTQHQNHLTETWKMSQVFADYNQFTNTTTLTHKLNNTKLTVQNKELYNELLAFSKNAALPWHKKNKGRNVLRNIALAAGIIGFFVLLYLLLVPWLSEKLAGTVSKENEQRMGDAVFKAMDIKAQSDSSKSVLLNDFFKAMNFKTEYKIKVTYQKNSQINAFALPGGNIVVYSALVDKLNNYDELAALLSHEFIHVQNGHATKRIFRTLGSKVFLSLLFGRMGGVTSVLIDNADDLRHLKYGRSQEKESDVEGIALLKQQNINPEGFVRLFEIFKSEMGETVVPEMLLSHPDLDNRIAHCKEAAKGATVKPQPELERIFNELKGKASDF
jgi:beta-barrel assembly-enhancing protease